MAESFVLVWHRLWTKASPAKQRFAPWVLTDLSTKAFARVQHQEGSWQGQVLSNSLPAKWRVHTFNDWFKTPPEAMAAVEAWMEGEAPALFGTDDLTILTWDDSDGGIEKIVPPPTPFLEMIGRNPVKYFDGEFEKEESTP